MLTQKGQSLIEVLVAMGVFITVTISGFFLFFGGQSLSVDSVNAQSALDYANQGIEAVRSIRDRNWTELPDGTHGLVYKNSQWTLATDTPSDTSGIFTRSVALKSVGAYLKIATTTITWETDPLRPQQIVLVEHFYEWEDVLNTGGDTGGTGSAGDWQNPATLGTVDLGPGNSATGLDVINKIVYMTAQASDNKKPDFFIVDATNGAFPVVATSTNTGPGLLSIDAAKNFTDSRIYAYVGNSDTNKQLQILDVTDIHNPSLLTSLKLSGVSGNGAIGHSIFYYAGKIYMGTKQANGPELHVIDVSTPSNPVELGSKEIGADVNAIYVHNNYAYLATSDDSKELQIFDISNPANLNLIGSFDATGSEDGLSIYGFGPTIYLGRDSNTDKEFYILDVTDPTHVQSIGSQAIGSAVNAIKVRDNLAFLGVSDSNKEFQVWNIGTPSNISLWSSFNFPQVANSIDYEDNVVYVAVRSNDALRIVTSQ